MVCLNSVWNIESFLQELCRWRKKLGDLLWGSGKRKVSTGKQWDCLTHSIKLRSLQMAPALCSGTSELQTVLCLQLKLFQRTAHVVLQTVFCSYFIWMSPWWDWDSVISDCILKAKTFQEGWVLNPRHELLLFTMIWSRFTRCSKCSLTSCVCRTHTDQSKLLEETVNSASVKILTFFFFLNLAWIHSELYTL